MKLLNILRKIIEEGKGDKYDFGCVMLYVDFPEMKKIQSQIEKEDIFYEEGDRSFGLEDSPHITLLYGLHQGVSTDMVKDVIKDCEYYDMDAYKISLFKSEEYDVLKFDIKPYGKSPNFLKDINNKLKKLEHTQTFPYHPHMTIAYLKSGKGEEYVKKFKDINYKLSPSNVKYSKSDGTLDNIKI